MNQKTIDHPDLKTGEEVENFTKVVKSSSGQLAIVDASVLKDLQNPLVNEAVIFPTKQTSGQEVYFKIMGNYDDATLRELTMTPASIEEVGLHKEKQEDKEAVQDTKEKDKEEKKEDPVAEDMQVLGHDRTGGVTGTVAKKIAKIETMGNGKKATRPYRNRLDSKNNRPAVSPANTVSSRMAERVSVKGAQRDNYGQGPDPESVKEGLEFFKRVKNNTLTEEFLSQMKYFDDMHRRLSEMRKLPGPYSDFIYESCDKLEAYRLSRISKETELIEELIQKGIPIDGRQ